MLPTGAPVSGFTPVTMQQQWATFAALSGQPNLANGPGLPVDRLAPGIMDSNNVLLGAFTPAYVRQFQGGHPSSPAIPGSSLPPSGAYNQHPTLGYAFPQPVDNSFGGRQFANPALAPTYPMQPFPHPGTATQSLSLSQAASLYGQSLPYFSSSLMPNLGNGALNHMPQPPAALVAAAMAGVNPARTFDSLKHFGALPQNQSRRNKPMITSKTNLYISGLSESDTDDTVQSLVENVVQPKSCKAIVHNGKCKGSGFIDCATEEDAEKAKNHILEYAKATGRKLSVKYAFENEKDVLNVYVRNLPRTGFTKEMLEKMFQDYGHVTSVKLLETVEGLTGIGFVRFATAEQAEQAVEQINKAKLVMAAYHKPVICKLADKAEPRRRGSAAGLQSLTGGPLQPFATALPRQLHAAAAAAAAVAMHPQQHHPQQHHLMQHQHMPANPPYARAPPIAPVLLPTNGAAMDPQQHRSPQLHLCPQQAAVYAPTELAANGPSSAPGNGPNATAFANAYAGAQQPPNLAAAQQLLVLSSPPNAQPQSCGYYQTASTATTEQPPPTAEAVEQTTQVPTSSTDLDIVALKMMLMNMKSPEHVAESSCAETSPPVAPSSSSSPPWPQPVTELGSPPAQEAESRSSSSSSTVSIEEPQPQPQQSLNGQTVVKCRYQQQQQRGGPRTKQSARGGRRGSEGRGQQQQQQQKVWRQKPDEAPPQCSAKL